MHFRTIRLMWTSEKNNQKRSSVNSAHHLRHTMCWALRMQRLSPYGVQSFKQVLLHYNTVRLWRRCKLIAMETGRRDWLHTSTPPDPFCYGFHGLRGSWGQILTVKTRIALDQPPRGPGWFSLEENPAVSLFAECKGISCTLCSLVCASPLCP